MFDTKSPGTRPDYNWVITDDVESLSAYVDTFKLGKLVPLTDLLSPVTDEQIASDGLLTLANQRKQIVMELPQHITEPTTYYTVLSAKDWAEMKHDLTKPKSPLAQTFKARSADQNWLSRWMQVQHLPTILTFVMTNCVFANSDTFWEIRLANSDVWRNLIAENIPPTHQYKRRT